MKRKFLYLLGATALGACLTLMAASSTDYDHQANFERYHTYSWIKVQASDQLWEQRIQQDIDQQLQGKGWQRVDSGGDAAVAAFGSTKERQTLNTFYDGFGGGWRWRGFGGDGMATTTVDVSEVGTLLVDIYDASNHHLIWRGTSSKALSDKPEKNEKKLTDTIDDLFKHFPPSKS